MPPVPQLHPARVPATGVGRALYARPGLLALVFVGGAVGTTLRYLLASRWPAGDGQWPWTTFAVNLTGSFALGALLTVLARGGSDDGVRRRLRLGLGTGLLGGYTTYSTFILETDQLLRTGHGTTAVVYALVSVVLGVAAAVVGVVAGRGVPVRRTSRGRTR